MSFLKKLFGGGRQAAGPAENDPVEYKGFQIVTAPINEGGQYRLAATISKSVDDEPRIHHLIRADIFPSHEEAVQFSLRKAKQVIDEQGETIFR